MEDNSIDIVIPWVDGNDPLWNKEKNLHLGAHSNSRRLDSSAIRYRDWDNLQYLFRGIEVFMPWVRTVHFVTSGHKPRWLNTNHPKLNWVKHVDYIPKEYLPTFSSHTIELNMHRIPGLSEHFIYFNDDTFILSKVKPSYFFKKGLPKDQCALLRVPTGPKYGEIVAAINDTFVINQNFNREDVIKQHWIKLFSLKNGILAPFLSLTYLPFKYFPGFLTWHTPQPFLKSIFSEIWEKEHDILHSTSMNKFRAPSDVNQYLMKYWQIVTGRFIPTNIGKNFRNFILSDTSSVERARKAISKQQYKLICLNDTDAVDFESTKPLLISEFERLLPNKSEYEL